MRGSRKAWGKFIGPTVAVALCVLAAGCTSTADGEPATPSTDNAAPTGPSQQASVGGAPDSSAAGTAESTGTSASGSVAGSAPSVGTDPSAGTDPAGPEVTARLQLADGGEEPSAELLGGAAEVMTLRVADIPGATVTTEPPDVLLITAPGDDTSLLEPVAAQGELLARPVTMAVPAGVGKYPEPTPTNTRPSTVEAWTTEVTTALQAGDVSCEGLPVPTGSAAPEAPTLACDGEQQSVHLLQPSLFERGFVDRAAAAQDSRTGGWTIMLTLDEAATRTWSTYTSEHLGEQVAFVVDGTIVSAPVINSPITTSDTAISGDFTADEAKALAASLNSGSLGLDVIDVELATG